MNWLFGGGKYNNTNIGYLNNNASNKKIEDWLKKTKKKLESRIKEYYNPKKGYNDSYAIIEFQDENEAVNFSNWILKMSQTNSTKLDKFLGEYTVKGEEFNYSFTLYDLNKNMKNLVGFGLFLPGFPGPKGGFRVINTDEIPKLASNSMVLYNFNKLPKVDSNKLKPEVKEFKPKESNKINKSIKNKSEKEILKIMEKEIKKTKNKNELNKVYRKLSLMVHPNKNPENTNKYENLFKELSNYKDKHLEQLEKKTYANIVKSKKGKK